MEEFTSEELEAARLPEHPGFYWAKRTPMAEYELTEVVEHEDDGHLFAIPPNFHRACHLVEVYEWNQPLEDAPQQPDTGPHERWVAETLLARRKEQRAVLKGLDRVAKKKKNKADTRRSV